MHARREDAGVIGTGSLNLTGCPAGQASGPASLSSLGQALALALQALMPRSVCLGLTTSQVVGVGMVGRTGILDWCSGGMSDPGKPAESIRVCVTRFGPCRISAGLRWSEEPGPWWTRLGGAGVGCWPVGQDSPCVQSLPHHLQLTARPWWPRRDQNTQRLLEGRLQMAKGTQVGKRKGWFLDVEYEQRCVPVQRKTLRRARSLCKGQNLPWNECKRDGTCLRGLELT